MLKLQTQKPAYQQLFNSMKFVLLIVLSFTIARSGQLQGGQINISSYTLSDPSIRSQKLPQQPILSLHSDIGEIRWQRILADETNLEEQNEQEPQENQEIGTEPNSNDQIPKQPSPLEDEDQEEASVETLQQDINAVENNIYQEPVPLTDSTPWYSAVDDARLYDIVTDILDLKKEPVYDPKEYPQQEYPHEPEPQQKQEEKKEGRDEESQNEEFDSQDIVLWISISLILVGSLVLSLLIMRKKLHGCFSWARNSKQQEDGRHIPQVEVFQSQIEMV